MTASDQPLKLDAISVSYGSHQALDSVTLAAQPGTVHALLGPNGAGKSTTIAIAVGLMKPSAGSARIFGMDPVDHHTRTSALTGVMLQDGGLPMSAKPLQVLAHLAALYSHPADYKQLAQRLGIPAFANRTIRRLSGGQRQRVALAAALVGRPRLVFLDEPTAGLDPQSQLAVFEVIEHLRADGVAVILTTHDMDDAARLADLVTVLDHGRVIASGTVRELTGEGNSTLRVTCVGEVDVASLATACLPFGEVKASGRDTLTVSGKFTTRSLNAFTGVLVEHGVDVETLSLSTRSLDDVFLDLTGRTLRS